MSAFFGIVNFDSEPVDEALARRMLDWISYLGPDAQSLWVDGSVALGHALFQTTFESAREAQPLTVDGVTIVADARLVARDDLLRELRGAGCPLETTATDVDLILNAYSVWGEDCLLHLQGDFVFAIWDARRKRLFAGRDHFGNYILYYARIGSTLVFSTEIMAVLHHPAVPRTINERSIGDFLLFGEQWLESSWTAYAQVFRLHRAYRLVATADRTAVGRYWNLATDQPELRYKTEDEYVEHFLSVMSQAVKERIRTDRVFISLSGGLDSSAVAAIAVDLVKRGEISAEISAYTMAYDRIHADNDEPYYAGLVAQALDIPIRFFSCDPYGFTLPLTMIAPEPLTVFQSGMHAVSSRQSGEQGRVYLTGVSGDEVLHESLLTESLRGMSVGGAVEEYLWLWRFTGKRPSLRGWRRYLTPLHRKPVKKRTFDYPAWLNPDFAKRVDLKNRFEEIWNWALPEKHLRHPHAYESTMRIDRQQRFEEFHTLDFCPPVAVAPFFDLRVINFALSLPPLPWFRRKYLLRRAFRGMLPEAVLERSKQPLGYLLVSLLGMPSSAWIDHWEAVPELETYVNRAAVPAIHGVSDPAAAFVNVRPAVLNHWLKMWSALPTGETER